MYKDKEDLIKKIEQFKTIYINKEEEGVSYVMNELCEYIGEIIRPIYNKRIIILSESNDFLKKKINYKRKIYFTEEQIRNTFKKNSKESNLIDYFLYKTNVSKNNNYAEFLITREDNILIFPFYNKIIVNNSKLLNFKNEIDFNYESDNELTLNLFE